MFKYIENERDTYPDTNQIIKLDKMGKYVIDEDLISKAANYDDKTDPLFSPDFVKYLEKRYKQAAKRALEHKMQHKHTRKHQTLKKFYGSL